MIHNKVIYGEGGGTETRTKVDINFLHQTSKWPGLVCVKLLPGVNVTKRNLQSCTEDEFETPYLKH